ncbi:heterokaryon incompatibility protein-domain-containing protein [Hypoxylon trugodes]|uniref:heterokaryon incompatibility protein-domain-containing protein n=1 Tax=Hypoxylon trugodes TaxID=326681 RepID=UPI00219601F4|nr:heterokaryon incompatibility protein-domain-containing protein [Hypoxylon trugodes]KAI1388661.1 heterokaryon incompatibility protein-domain-containing protein [Hypoxylon trugodes]
MWLINTHNFELVRKDNYRENSYAILSHTWEDDEVSFQEFRDPDPSVARRKKGFAKIEKTVLMARERGLNWAWVDTCCIDKTSSAELSEAINSMYKWYEDSAVCFAYLSDMPTHPDILSQQPDDLWQLWKTKLKACKWLTRGWTLQELIAPMYVEFYDMQWNLIGDKKQSSALLEEITRIPRRIIEPYRHPNGLRYQPQHEPIACRMSWASSRETTRIEDTAYCLLGIFGINMPLLYGEGAKAFIRLQEEICKQTTDMSLFAWKASPPPSIGEPEQEFRGLFANHPCEFSEGHFMSIYNMGYTGEITITNRGIRFDGLNLRVNPEHGILMEIGCRKKYRHGVNYPGMRQYICLAKVPRGFVRHNPYKLFDDTSQTEKEIVMFQPRIYIPKDLPQADAFNIATQYNDALFVGFSGPIKNIIARPSDLWDPHRKAFLVGSSQERFAIHLTVGSAIETSKLLGEPFIVVILLEGYIEYRVLSTDDEEFHALLPILEKEQPIPHIWHFDWVTDPGSNGQPFTKTGDRFEVTVIGESDHRENDWIQIKVESHDLQS